MCGARTSAILVSRETAFRAAPSWSRHSTTSPRARRDRPCRTPTSCWARRRQPVSCRRRFFHDRIVAMKSLKKKRRIQVIAISAISLTVCFAIFYFLVPADAINFFRSPSQVAETPPLPTEVFRIGGLVEEGTLRRGRGYGRNRELRRRHLPGH